jgi:hypothetical protein
MKEAQMNGVKRSLLIGLAMAALTAGSLMTLAAGNGWGKNCVQAIDVLPSEVQASVLDALLGAEGEYAAYATYAAILEQYGNVNPFSSIMEAEARHIDALKGILDRYGVEYPMDNPYLGAIQVPESLAAAARAGAEAEIANVTLYEQQLEVVADYPDILAVFMSLQTASLEKHLPAFERAAARY